MHTINGGGGLTATVDVVHGGRIVSLASGGREWLSPSSPLPKGAPRTFVHSGTGGWDEAIPTVEACVLADGTVLADHGEVWDREWQVTSASEHHLGTAVSLQSLPLVFERLITATTSGLRFDWRVTTASTAPVSFLWSAHPLFAADLATRVTSDAPGEATGEYPQRGAAAPSRLALGDLDEGAALKAFVSGATRASVVHADGSAITLAWSAADLPHLGLYLDRGEFTTRGVVAIEPTMAATDSAARAPELWSVSAGLDRVWHLDVSTL